MKTLPHKIKVKFTELDLEQAGEFTDCQNCLVATALKRRHFNLVYVSAFMVTVQGTRFIPDQPIHTSALKNWDDWKLGDKPPTYRKELVGQTFSFTQGN